MASRGISKTLRAVHGRRTSQGRGRARSCPSTNAKGQAVLSRRGHSRKVAGLPRNGGQRRLRVSPVRATPHERGHVFPELPVTRLRVPMSALVPRRVEFPLGSLSSNAPCRPGCSRSGVRLLRRVLTSGCAVRRLFAICDVADGAFTHFRLISRLLVRGPFLFGLVVLDGSVERISSQV